MKKNTSLFILLLSIYPIISSENKTSLTLIPQKPQEEIIPLVIGNKAFSLELLASLPEDKRKKLHEISRPSWIERSYGMSDQVVSYQNVQAIIAMPDEVKKNMKVKVLDASGSCLLNRNCCGPVDAEERCGDYWALGTCVPIGILSTLSAVVFGTVISFSNPSAAFFSPLIAVVPPVCAAASGECSNCIYHRYCAQQEVWLAQNNEESTSQEFSSSSQD